VHDRRDDHARVAGSGERAIRAVERVVRAGEGSLAFEIVGDRTSIASARARSPLKLLTPKNHGDARWTFVATYGGGLVDGDAIALDVQVGEGAKALIGTQASTKVYKCPSGEATQTLEARVSRGGLLVVAPDPLVPFAGAKYAQRATIRLEEGASLAWLDVLSCGRASRGERWAFSRYSSRTRVFVNGALACDDALVLDSKRELARSFGRFDAIATILLFGIEPRPVATREDVVASSSSFGAGTYVRIAGTSTAAVVAYAREVLAGVRASLGDDPWARKW
jgi:urease accessory protein